MPVVVIANPKGGVGKTTLATNLAGYFARHGHAVMLGDTDRQQSSRAWLGLRPARCGPGSRSRSPVPPASCGVCADRCVASPVCC